MSRQNAAPMSERRPSGCPVALFVQWQEHNFLLFGESPRFTDIHGRKRLYN